MLVHHFVDRMSSGWDKSFGRVLGAFGLCYHLDNQSLLFWITSVLHGEVGPVLTMELASLMLHWSKFYTLA